MQKASGLFQKRPEREGSSCEGISEWAIRGHGAQPRERVIVLHEVVLPVQFVWEVLAAIPRGT
jgi:hypothetical protein